MSHSSLAPNHPTTSPFLRPPNELKIYIAELLILIRKQDGTPLILYVRRTQMLQKWLFSIGMVNKELHVLLDGLALGFYTFSLQAIPFEESEISLAFIGKFRMNIHVDKYSVLPVVTNLSGKALSLGERREKCIRMELPPPGTRPHIKHLELVLHIPKSKDVSGTLLDNDRLDYQKLYWRDIDWLLPVREVKALGFGRLSSLGIKIELKKWADEEGTLAAKRVKEWTDYQIGQIAIDAKEMELVYLD